MDPTSTQRRLAAIFSADVVGYSRLMAADEEGTVRTLRAHRDLMDELIQQHGGRTIDAVGDNLLAKFPSAVEAVAVAVAIQSGLARRNEELPPDRRMLFRIGVNLGDVIVEDDRIYGDGVNVAARVEALAPEGGVAISGTVFDQVEGKLALEFEDVGQHRMKNMPRPVRVYHVGRGGKSRASASSLTVSGFAGRPAIAVLPFENMSGDPEDEYFADGIAEDLITRLSRWRMFPVIARNSSFVYKGKSVDVKRVSRELGARYVVEGSVRRAGKRVRVTAQLADATTGHQVWAERYDREFGDIFALQDEITEAIVGSMDPELWQFETERAAAEPPGNLDAWDCAQRGIWHWNRLTRGDNARARELFERASELDPRFALSFYGLALTHLFDIQFQWTEDPARSIAELERSAQRSVGLDPRDPLGQFALGIALAFHGDREKMLDAFELATALNPSLPWARCALGVSFALLGRAEEGIPHVEEAMRLSPRDPMMWVLLDGMGRAQFAAGRYEEAAAWARRSIQVRAGWPLPYTILAASQAQLGRLDEARATLAELERKQPHFSIAAVTFGSEWAKPDFLERLAGGLRKAGLRE